MRQGRRTAMQNRDLYLMILGMTLVTYLTRALSLMRPIKKVGSTRGR